MIVLDTHIWVWWVHGDKQLTKTQASVIEANETNGIGVSAISCWEIAKLVEYGRLELPCVLKEWFEQALNYPGIRLLELTPEIAIESTQLPGEFHRDPADQIIVATARVYDCLLVTSDRKLLNYPQVGTIQEDSDRQGA
ncbi:MAG: type II toxin-antitoxin system VapC family toxin [Chloroflexi bacterium]|nr:type II toxin-antitoxin system VapC family toxin [Chloroflexota bacterium]